MRTRIPALAAAAMLLALLTACSPPSTTDDSRGGETTEPTGAASGASGGAPVVASLNTFTCDDLGRLAPVFTAPMAPSPERFPGDRHLLCVWENAASIDDGVDDSVDIKIRVDYLGDFDQELTDTTCAANGIAESPELEALGGCLTSGFTPDPAAELDRSARAIAQVPYYEFEINATCKHTVACVPDLPTDFTPEAAQAALAAIAERVTAGA